MKSSISPLALKILKILEAEFGQFISGELLCQQLNVSRTAIWKQMKQLRNVGMEIQSSPQKGYCLTYIPEDLQQAEIRHRAPLYFFQNVTSTQWLAHQFANEGAQHGSVIIAEQQTAGRGRLQRKWHSPYGRGIWLSLIWRPEISVQAAPHFTLLAAVAVCAALRDVTNLNIGIKWPIDLLLNGRKIAGILLETVSEASQVRFIIVGIGINVNQNSLDFSEDTQNIATSLRIASGKTWSRSLLIEQLLQYLEYYLHQYLEQGFKPIREKWKSWNVTLQNKVKLTTHQGVIEGIAETIDDHGALIIIDESGQRYKNYSGDLELSPMM
jgi:BirA family biotin operon repressor/biotin-[acetyl-CoA-carboxylase] ligase